MSRFDVAFSLICGVESSWPRSFGHTPGAHQEMAAMRCRHRGVNEGPICQSQPWKSEVDLVHLLGQKEWKVIDWSSPNTDRIGRR